MLVNFDDFVSKAVESDHAVACVTIAGYEDARTVIKASEYLKKPVILAADKHLFESESISNVTALLKRLAQKAKVPVGLHLNKGFTKEQVVEAINAGFCTVAFDGSDLPLEQNILATREIVKAARISGVCVEGFISSGDVFVAEALVRESGVSLLNVTAAPEGNIIDLAEAVEIPLTASLSEKSVRQVSISGIVKYDLGPVLSQTFVEQFENELHGACTETEREAVLRRKIPVIQEFSCKLLRQFYRPVILGSETKDPIWGFPARD